MVQKSKNFIVIFNTNKELETLRTILINILSELESRKELSELNNKALSGWFDEDMAKIRFVHRLLNIQKPTSAINIHLPL